MSHSHPLCVLIAEIVGGDRLITRLGEKEAGRALDRCLNRVDVAVAAGSGKTIARDHAAVIATFEQCDDAVMAACEAIERVRKLPLVSGILMQLRLGIHFGKVENDTGEGVDGARLILQACDANQSLASASVIDKLAPAVRKFVSAEAFHDDALDALHWPVFVIGTHNNAATTATSLPTTSLRPRTGSGSPLTSLKPLPATSSVPPDASLKPLFTEQPPSIPRMQLKHHQNILILDEKRPVVLLGRELGNDIVIIDPRASRQHARIERQREGFMLIDESTNGCFVTPKGHEQKFLKGKSMFLTGSGSFGCGFSPQEFEDDTIHFKLV